MNDPASKKIEGWFRRLQDERLEIYLKVERIEGIKDRKIRASGPETEMYDLVDWFEEKTGLRFDSPTWRRVRSGPRPIEGQIELISERPSEDREEVRDGELSSVRS